MADISQDRSVVSEVHTARRILLEGNPGEALERLRAYDTLEFATLRIVLGECYYSLGDFRRARDEFKYALRLAPNSPRAEILLELSTSMLDLERASSPAPQTILHNNASSEDHTDLGQLARTLSGVSAVKVSPAPSSPIPSVQESGEIGLVSETLAKIMTEQGQFEEARKVYIQLSRLNPDRYEYFRERMDALDHMKNEPQSHP